MQTALSGNVEVDVMKQGAIYGYIYVQTSRDALELQSPSQKTHTNPRVLIRCFINIIKGSDGLMYADLSSGHLVTLLTGGIRGG